MKHLSWLVKAQNSLGRACHLQIHFLLKNALLQRKFFKNGKIFFFFFGWGTSSDFNVLHLSRAEKLKTVLYYISKTAQGLAAKGIKWLSSQKHTTLWITLLPRKNELVGTILCCSWESQLDKELWILSCPFHQSCWRFAESRRNVQCEIHKEGVKSKRLLMTVNEAENRNVHLGNLDLWL